MNLTKYTTEELIAGESEEDTELLKIMARSARTYITSHRWCPSLRALYLAYGIGGVVALFIVQLTEKLNGQDEFLWVIEGDLPSAYMVIDELPGPREALESYIELMEEWACRVCAGKSLDDVFPVNAPATKENAEALLQRMEFLRTQVIPQIPVTVH